MGRPARGEEVNKVLGWKRPGHGQVGYMANRHFADGFGVSPQAKGFKIDLSSNNESIMGPVLDQGSVGDCVENGIEECAAACLVKYGRPRIFFSRLYLYARVRKNIMGEGLTEDSGSSITDGVVALERYGICPEEDWPSVPPETRFSLDPGPDADAAAAPHKALRAYFLSDLDWIRACLTYGFPVVFGFSVPQSFYSVGPGGQLNYPKPGEPFVGGHCVVAFGHDDTRINDVNDVGAFRCRNSWGSGWGDSGDFWMPYSYQKSGIATEFWTIHQVA